MYNFDAGKTADELVAWISNYFDKTPKNTKAVVGVSGGKDSAVVAALCTKALGKDRVVGVMMPQGEQPDIDYSKELCEYLGITNITINIGETVKLELATLEKATREMGFDKLSTITIFNTPARIRMTTLYGIAGTVNGRVANTCNLSEDWVGYATKFGDGAGDFSPLMKLTVQEVKAVGVALALPDKFIEKTPIDGLCGMSDEENLGFSYNTLDAYIRDGICEDEEIRTKIDNMHKANVHKLLPMEHYDPLISHIDF